MYDLYSDISFVLSVDYPPKYPRFLQISTSNNYKQRSKGPHQLHRSLASHESTVRLYLHRRHYSRDIIDPHTFSSPRPILSSTPLGSPRNTIYS